MKTSKHRYLGSFLDYWLSYYGQQNIDYKLVSPFDSSVLHNSVVYSSIFHHYCAQHF